VAHETGSLVTWLQRGDKAAELLVQQPTKFELVANFATARVIGLALAQTLLIRAHAAAPTGGRVLLRASILDGVAAASHWQVLFARGYALKLCYLRGARTATLPRRDNGRLALHTDQGEALSCRDAVQWSLNNKVMLRDSAAIVATKRSQDARSMPPVQARGGMKAVNPPS